MHETREAREWRGFPEDCVAIADDGRGDLLVYRPARARIERWDRETGECAAVDVHWATT